ncbi:Glutathione-dependent formaldehyde-activating enzyme [Cytospora mali]|uniref:Glutathione-dependent formaldehyde-activating enzyme n=1 Tax=Cytospora mali TaxID=578113 RepID=A0A194VNL1_CYTMA|nr:Glutathione-dependent formaldehyde-activating enzyme [Valsa mali]
MLARLQALGYHIYGSHSILTNPTLWRPFSTMALNLTGTCTCKKLQYTIELESADQARTTLCHCSSCKKAFGTNYGLTAKIPIDSFKYSKGEPKLFKQDNGVVRDFCNNCGSFICEYGEAAADKFRYITYGSLDDPEQLPPKGEFFCEARSSWMPKVPDTFQKQKIKE